MAATRVAACAVVSGKKPKPWNQAIMPREAREPPITKARVPATDFDGAKFQWLEPPSLRPTMSARPSPTAIWQTASTPQMEVRQQATVAVRRTSTYRKGPLRASLRSPDLDMALTMPPSFSASVEPATQSLARLTRGTMAARARAVGAPEYRGQMARKIGALPIWIILRDTLELTRPPAASVFQAAIHAAAPRVHKAAHIVS
mmetsp:Transcript_12746/g.43138  ORF Transcript_12746/g.43138 Transcript_12746/m.43138 type:complete len:202 (+) Transcript_12746:364-969(+)